MYSYVFLCMYAYVCVLLCVKLLLYHNRIVVCTFDMYK